MTRPQEGQRNDMTQYPGQPTQFPGYQSPTTPTAPLRPTSVTVLAIIGIIFGGIGILCKPVGVAAMFIPQPAGANPMLDLQKQMMAWNVANAVVGTLVSVLLLASSIGSLSLKRWARKGMLAYAGLAVVLTLIGGVVSVVWVLPKAQEAQRQMMAQQASRGAAPPPQMMNIMQAAGTAGAVIGIVLALVFPIAIAYFYTRPAIKAAFEGTGAAPGYGGPPQYGPPPSGGGYYQGQ
jgi:hypothetical protein